MQAAQTLIGDTLTSSLVEEPQQRALFPITDYIFSFDTAMPAAENDGGGLVVMEVNTNGSGCMLLPSLLPQLLPSRLTRLLQAARDAATARHQPAQGLAGAVRGARAAQPPPRHRNLLRHKPERCAWWLTQQAQQGPAAYLSRALYPKPALSQTLNPLHKHLLKPCCVQCPWAFCRRMACRP